MDESGGRLSIETPNMSAMNAAAPATEADAPPHANETAPPVCPLCCEEILAPSSSSSVILSACRHRSCRSCLVRWIEQEEASGHAASPACPFCRASIAEGDVLSILGRPFGPREARAGWTGEVDGADDLTRGWIEQHAVACGSCGSLIEKAGGCDLMECLCGHRFCYRCGAAGGRCGCNHGHGFLDDGGRVADPPIRDGRGVVDIGSCIRRREVRERRRGARERRAREGSEHEDAGRDLSWLFLPAGAGLRVLEGMGRAEAKRTWRARAREARGKGLSDIDAFLASGAWLFQKPSRAGSQDHLLRLHGHSEKKEQERISAMIRGMFDRSFCMPGSTYRKLVEEKEELRLKMSIFFVFPGRDEGAEE